ncbi:MAG: hypothetical protein ACRC4L_02660 [Mycoplasma sp.]
MKLNLFIFWLGDEKIKKTIINNLQRLLNKYKEINLVVGPSDEDHQYLYDNYKFYRQSYDKKTFAFCSDVWRLYMLSKNDNSFYIDATANINVEKFAQFIELTKKFDLILLYESKIFFENGIIYNKYKEDKIINKCLSIYKKSSFKSIVSGPYLITKYIYKQYGFNLGYQGNEKLFALHPREFISSNENAFFNYQGLSSWNGSTQNKAQECYMKKMLNFNEGESLRLLSVKRRISIFSLHHFFDFILPKKILIKTYYKFIKNKS